MIDLCYEEFSNNYIEHRIISKQYISEAKYNNFYGTGVRDNYPSSDAIQVYNILKQNKLSSHYVNYHLRKTVRCMRARCKKITRIAFIKLSEAIKISKTFSKGITELAIN